MNANDLNVSLNRNSVVVRAKCTNAKDYAELCDLAQEHNDDDKNLIIVPIFDNELYAQAYEAVKTFYRTHPTLKHVAVEPFPPLDTSNWMFYKPLNIELIGEMTKTLKGIHGASALLYAEN